MRWSTALALKRLNHSWLVDNLELIGDGTNTIHLSDRAEDVVDLVTESVTAECYPLVVRKDLDCFTMLDVMIELSAYSRSESVIRVRRFLGLTTGTAPNLAPGIRQKQ